MHRTSGNLLGLGLLLLVSCDDGNLAGSAHGELQAAEAEFGADSGTPPQTGDATDAGARREGDQGVRQLADAGAPTIGLICPQGGNTGPVAVVFACDRITVVTCKDLSNVVIERADGSRQRLQGLKGHRNVFVSAGGQAIAGVWVKAGENRSGDGPGYGERFDAPSLGCADAGTLPPQNPPVPPPASDACVPGPDMPCFTPPGQPPSPPPSQPPTDEPASVD